MAQALLGFEIINSHLSFLRAWYLNKSESGGYGLLSNQINLENPR